MKEKHALEERNITVIDNVYQRLSEDKEVQGRIRGCGWLKNDNIKSTYGARRAAYVCGPLLARWWKNDSR